MVCYLRYLASSAQEQSLCFRKTSNKEVAKSTYHGVLQVFGFFSLLKIPLGVFGIQFCCFLFLDGVFVFGFR